MPSKRDAIMLSKRDAVIFQNPPCVFQFCIYNERNPSDAFNWIINAPTRVDERP